MRLQEKLALYNTVTKITIILVLGIIIVFSLEKISLNHLDNRLVKKSVKLLSNINDREIDSLLNAQHVFTDYNILKDEFIVLTAEPAYKEKGVVNPNIKFFATEEREIKGDIEIYRILKKDFKYKDRYYNLEIGVTMTGIVALKSTLRLYMLIVLVVALLVTLITDHFFMRFLLQPFYQIIDRKLNQVNDPISFDDTPIPTTTTDFSLLDSSINTLMRRISNLFIQEKQFIANVSHELLTPISVLNSRLENMLAAEDLPLVHENKILASLKTLSRLKSIINSLLLISKIENEQYLKNDEISIRKELDEIYEVFEEKICSKQLSYLNKANEDFQFIGNLTLIHILMTNIINNAIKYSLENGEISITDKNIGGQYHLYISDNGIGMSKEAAEKAFNRFERENNDNENGLGLGLAIAHRIAKFHQIELVLQSEKNKGTTVTVIFPVI